MANSRRRTRVTGAVLVSGVGVAVAMGLGAATAHAGGSGEAPIDAWSNYEWCPGDPIPESDAPLTWDTSTCHYWHYQSMRDGAPSLIHIIEGLRPNPCPPIPFIMCP
jgi:hypothetical protein